MKKVLVLVLASLLIFSFAVSAQEMTLRLADNQPEGYPTVVGAKEFARLVEERTDGRIKIEVYPGGILGDESSTIEQVQFGAIDFVRTSITPMANFEPAMNVLSLPYLYPSEEYMFQVLQSEIGEGILEGLKDAGIVGLTWYDAGARSFYTADKKVTSPEDLEGLRIRVQESQLMMDMVEALGASPTPIAWGEVYSALQTGVVDAGENNYPGWYYNSHHEVAPNFVEDEHNRIPELIIMSKITWDKLSAEDQKIIKQAAVDSTEVQREAWDKRTEEAKKLAVEEGATITTLTPEQKQAFQDKVKGLYPKYSEGYEDLLNSILNFEMEE
ncbi:TRAP transporter substrate-binding protein [Halanaerobium sp. ST460_2HS_T2]|jgi:tripartite ATP-independent transporter DctP family solute receptor|uniref:TRAP transporter substrate-binding protein n=1 Tax=Halanaerobium sp. ST460_2HS_T2 TaxID=2183914 RepID=UPI000DE5FC1F|nr:TRAP transporter substrate-binding protein [Halanaerobium sp. ST460_2HS_T2]PUU88045.1 MAG: TRAP dicarboxylate transporter subunit DctP [Halanaerobium sp.]RCW61922.1 tripartite ATP-independent transporter DctP family solute receptor [Halanaerobium sp. ST460_2HS_T2]